MICPNCELNLDSQHSKDRSHMNAFTSTYYCPKCKEEFIVWGGMKPGHYAIEKGRYRLYCIPETNKCEVQKVYMDIESDTSIMYRWYSILEIDAIPQGITDENFDEKVKLMLVFS